MRDESVALSFRAFLSAFILAFHIRVAAMIVMANRIRKESMTIAIINVACFLRCSTIERTGQAQCSQVSVSGVQSLRHWGQGMRFINFSQQRFSISCGSQFRAFVNCLCVHHSME